MLPGVPFLYLKKPEWMSESQVMPKPAAGAKFLRIAHCGQTTNPHKSGDSWCHPFHQEGVIISRMSYLSNLLNRSWLAFEPILRHGATRPVKANRVLWGPERKAVVILYLSPKGFGPAPVAIIGSLMISSARLRNWGLKDPGLRLEPEWGDIVSRRFFGRMWRYRLGD